MPSHWNNYSYKFQGAFWRAPFKSFSPRSVFGKSRLRGLLVIARSLLAVAKKSGGASKGYHYARRRGDSSSFQHAPELARNDMLLLILLKESLSFRRSERSERLRNLIKKFPAGRQARPSA